MMLQMPASSTANHYETSRCCQTTHVVAMGREGHTSLLKMCICLECIDEALQITRVALTIARVAG